MAKLGISTGSAPNDGTGDTLLLGADKINSNFDELYNFLGDGVSLSGIVTSLTAGSNISLSGSTGNVTINATSSSGANVTISDDPPLSPNTGDLWWESDAGRLKVYYSNVWVDSNPAGGNSGGGGGGGTYSDGDVDAHLNIGGAISNQVLSWSGTDYAWVEDTDTTYTAGIGVSIVGTQIGLNSTSSLSFGGLTIDGHVVPQSNGVYDLGTVNEKWRSLYADSLIVPSSDVNNLGITSSVYEGVSNNFNTSLTPNTGTLVVNTSTAPIIVGALAESVTTWNFTNVDLTNSKAITVTLLLDSNSLYTYGDDCEVNGSTITGGVRWAGGIAPVATNNDDILTFSIITDGAGTTRVYGTSTLNYS